MSKFKSAIEKFTKLSMFVSEFSRDMALYIRYCGVSPLQDPTKKRYYKLLIEAHALEKGLSLKDPRPLFGKAKITFLMRELERYDLSYSPFPAQMVLGVFDTYLRNHRERGIVAPLLDELEAYLSRMTRTANVAPNGGLRHFDTAYQFDSISPSVFLASRFSNRVMSQEPMSLDLISAAVKVAQSAPSQCNRQAAQVHFYQQPAKISELLALQGGAGGFAQEVGNLFVVSCDLAAWGGAQQRNQLYVDGALFSMALIYALHAVGIATCPLNLAVRNTQEKRIKAAGGIPQDQRLIMMIAVGAPTGDGAFKAAASPRRDTAEMLHIHA